MTFQLNVNLGFEDGGNWYVYWIQDVAEYDTSNNYVYFIDNVWNSSGPGYSVFPSTLNGNGQVATYDGQGYYYDVASPSLQGNFVYLTYPSTFGMILNTSVNGNGQPVVDFIFQNGGSWATFDRVTFSFVSQLDYSDGFVVTSATPNPADLGYDAEIVLGGPGGGSSTSDQGSDVQLTLQYWNGNNYQMIQNGENHGEDTGETITNAEVDGYYYAASGFLYAGVIAGTENIDQLWGSTTISFVNIDGPGTCAGTLFSGSVGTPYLGGYGSITVWPVSPDFQVSCDGFTLDLGTHSLSAGGTTTLNAGTWADLNFGESGLSTGANWQVSIGSATQSGPTTVLSFYLPTGSYSYSVSGPSSYLPQPSGGPTSVASTGGAVAVNWQLVQVTPSAMSGSVDLGQGVDFSVALNGAANDSYSWSGLPGGCSSNNATVIVCRPNSAGGSQVTVEVSDGNGYHATSAALEFVTFSDPTVGPPEGSFASSDVGQTVVFTVASTPGSGSDTVAWAGLPPGCVSANSTSVTCSPLDPGSFAINVTMTDSNGISVSSSGPFAVFALPTVGPVGVSPGTSILAGSSLTFDLTATPGSGGLAYVWNNLPSGCHTVDSNSLTCTPAAAGTWNVTVTVSDSNHGTATSVGVTISVQPSFLGLPALEGYTILGVVLVAIVATLLAVGLRRRNRRKGAEASDLTVAERVRMYPGRAGTASSQGSAAPSDGVWADGVPAAATASLGEPSPESESNVGLEPGSAAMAIPLINPPEPVCWHCQFKNPPASLYCSECGLPLEPPPIS